MIPLDIILGLGSKLIDAVFPDPAKKAEAQLKLLELQQNGELAQMQAQTAINVEEAKSTSVFIAGWRPFVGWVCGMAFAINFVVGPMGVFAAAFFGKTLVFPTIALTEIMPVLLGMLGLGAYRTFEKVKDVEGNR